MVWMKKSEKFWIPDEVFVWMRTMFMKWKVQCTLGPGKTTSFSWVQSLAIKTLKNLGHCESNWIMHVPRPNEITGNVICIIAFSVSIYIFANRLNDAMNADLYYLLCKWTMHVTFFLCKLKVFVCKLSCYYACTYSIGHMQSLYE